MKEKPGYEIVFEPTSNHTGRPVPIVGLTTFKDRIFCATAEGVYELAGGRWCRMEFAEPDAK